MTFVVVLPVLDADAAVACVDTMAPELRDRLVLIDQGDRPSAGLLSPMETFRPRQHRRRLRPRRNIGISRCMNHALDRARAHGAELIVWVSTSMRFGDDGGRLLVDAGLASTFGAVGLPAQFHAAALRVAAFDLAGRWDENFYPAYYEDTDWRRRLALASGDPDPLALLELPGHARDGHGYDTLREAMPGRLPIDFEALQEYYASKWGGCPPHSAETFDLPFGDQPIGYWPEATIETLIDRYGLGR